MNGELNLLAYTDFVKYEPEHYNFILSTWAHSFKSSPYAGVVPNNIWHATVKETVDQLLSRGAMVLMAVSSDDHDQYMGFCCFERAKIGISVVHYCFVKEDFRKEGIGERMLEIVAPEDFVYTFRAPEQPHWMKRGCHVPAIGRRKDLEPVYERKRRDRDTGEG